MRARPLRSTVAAMAPNRQPTTDDRSDAIRIATPRRLASGEPSEEILAKLGVLHLRHNTFTAEELLELTSDATEESCATPADPIYCEGMRERFFPTIPSPRRRSTRSVICV